MGSYLDPVFNETVRRLTSDHAHDDIYARNMWWNADGTRYLHRTIPDTWKVVNAATGQVTHSNINNGFFPGDGGFDPADPNVLYYLAASAIHKITLGSSGSVTASASSWARSATWRPSGPRTPSSASPPRTPPSNSECGSLPPTTGPWRRD